jgi:hypothetical protein
VEDWGYFFEVFSDAQHEALEKIQKEIDIFDAQEKECDKKYYEKYKDTAKDPGNPKYFNLLEDTSQWRSKKEEITKNRDPFVKEKFRIMAGEKPQKVNCHLRVGMDGHLTNIVIEKIKETGKETVYEKGDNQGTVTPQQKIENLNKGLPEQALLAPNIQPESPKPGQIYFNSTDSHFYGWNGTEWVQLDKNKN